MLLIGGLGPSLLAIYLRPDPSAGRRSHKPILWLGLFSVIILVGMWMERSILVMPSLSPEHVWVGLPEIAVSLGFLGLFGWRVQAG